MGFEKDWFPLQKCHMDELKQFVCLQVEFESSLLIEKPDRLTDELKTNVHKSVPDRTIL